MRERIRITVFCVYVLCFFSFIMYSLNNSDKRIISTANPIKENELVIVVDAGHGGSDGGAVASDGTFESVLNLQIADKLNDTLSAIGFKTYMTRTDDNSIGDRSSTIRNEKVSDIHKRMDIMNSFENCIFVSIHQNFYSGVSSWGTQVFYSGNNSESELIAQSVQSSVSETLQNDNKRMVKKSGSEIYLLYHAEKPAILIECGFMSNINELEKLKNDTYQQEIAYSITNGIINYLIEKGVLYGF